MPAKTPSKLGMLLTLLTLIEQDQDSRLQGSLGMMGLYRRSLRGFLHARRLYLAK